MIACGCPSAVLLVIIGPAVLIGLCLMIYTHWKMPK